MSSNSQTRSGGSGSNDSFNSQVSVDDNTFETIETVDTSAEMKEHGSTSARAAALTRLSNPIADDLVVGEDGQALGDPKDDNLDDSMADVKDRALKAREARQVAPTSGSTNNWILTTGSSIALTQPEIVGMGALTRVAPEPYNSPLNRAKILNFIDAGISSTISKAGWYHVKVNLNGNPTSFDWFAGKVLKDRALLDKTSLGSAGGKISGSALELYGFYSHITSCPPNIWENATLRLKCGEATSKLLEGGKGKDLDFDFCLKKVEAFFKSKKVIFIASGPKGEKKVSLSKKRTADAMNSSNAEPSSSSSKNNKVPASKAAKAKGPTKNPNKDIIKAMEDRNSKKAKK